jgi:CDP-diacylglycerol--serine O-phosphatidyltransferase
LARFNIEGADKNHFIGLPTPAMAMFFGSLPLLLRHPDFSFLQSVLISNPGLIFLTLIFVLLMNAKFDLFSFKSLKTGRLDSFFKVFFGHCCPSVNLLFWLGWN